MKSIVNLAAPVAAASFPGLYVGDKGNIFLLTDEKNGTVVGTVEGASKPKPLGYVSETIVLDKFKPLPSGTKIELIAA